MFFLVERRAAVETWGHVNRPGDATNIVLSFREIWLYQKTTHFESCGKILEKYWIYSCQTTHPKSSDHFSKSSNRNFDGWHQRLNFTADPVNAMFILNMRTRLWYRQTPSLLYYTAQPRSPCGRTAFISLFARSQQLYYIISYHIILYHISYHIISYNSTIIFTVKSCITIVRFNHVTSFAGQISPRKLSTYIVFGFFLFVSKYGRYRLSFTVRKYFLKGASIELKKELLSKATPQNKEPLMFFDSKSRSNFTCRLFYWTWNLCLSS